jgi:hypothetical protein
MAIELDHLMWGAPSLEVGIMEAERLFGVAPAPGGVHPGGGTCNALLSLGEATYLEVIAPDAAQDLTGTLGGRLKTLTRPGLITWAAAAQGLSEFGERAAALELVVRGPIPSTRAAPDGGMLSWELMFLGGHPFGSLVPFFIDWLGTPHPATTNPQGGSFREIVIQSPAADRLNQLFTDLDIAVRAEPSEQPGLTVLIDTGNGEVRLETTAETREWSF